MDNKYGLGSTKVAIEHHESHHSSVTSMPLVCKFCQGTRLILCLTMQDHRCEDCGEWQIDIPQGYSTGRSSNY